MLLRLHCSDFIASQRDGAEAALGGCAWPTRMPSSRGSTYVSKDALFSRAEVLTIHLVVSQRSRGLVGAAELGLMKPTPLLVNTSRGPIADEQAVIEALRSRAIAAAGLDVFEIEPLPPGHPLRSLDNVIATPHIGYVADRIYRTFYGQAAAKIARWLVEFSGPGN
ncbi:NAD(P)-dependent oxidoreductase [uncultured Mycobacterium sp.]|uniref:NAD(P)-dependent oxidoreductase n=1 Tax=uncultured Mycobacterium sp. TaxID=171292 RepID=UPI0035C9A9AB